MLVIGRACRRETKRAASGFERFGKAAVDAGRSLEKLAAALKRCRMPRSIAAYGESQYGMGWNNRMDIGAALLRPAANILTTNT